MTGLVYVGALQMGIGFWDILYYSINVLRVWGVYYWDYDAKV